MPAEIGDPDFVEKQIKLIKSHKRPVTVVLAYSVWVEFMGKENFLTHFANYSEILKSLTSGVG